MIINLGLNDICYKWIIVFVLVYYKMIKNFNSMLMIKRLFKLKYVKKGIVKIKE